MECRCAGKVRILLVYRDLETAKAAAPASAWTAFLRGSGVVSSAGRARAALRPDCPGLAGGAAEPDTTCRASGPQAGTAGERDILCAMKNNHRKR